MNAKIYGKAKNASYSMKRGMSTLVELEGGKYPTYLTVLDFSAKPESYKAGENVSVSGNLMIRKRECKGVTYHNMTLVVED